MRFFLISILSICLLLQSGCSSKKLYKKSALLMGTFVEIQVVASKGSLKTYLDSLIKKGFDEARRVDRKFSSYSLDSELSYLNDTAGIDPYQASEEFIFLLDRSSKFYQLTENAFDISIKPLEGMWERASKANKLPTDTEIKETLEFVGMNKVSIDKEDNKVILPEGMQLDFGGIAKGYAVDRVIETLKKQGITNAIVNAGGDIYCLGSGSEEIGWHIGIQHPRKNDEYIATLLVKNRAIATSGDYQRFYVIEDEKVSHIIDPRTGMPVADVPTSVTVLASDCTTADALATAIFVLGPEEGLELLNRLDDVEGVIISKGLETLNVETSKGLKQIDIYDEE